MHLALQNLKRHRLPRPHLRLPQHALHLPHATPSVPPSKPDPAIPDAPNPQRKPQPHTSAAQRRRPRERDSASGHGEIQDCEAGQRSGDRGRETAERAGAAGQCGGRVGGGRRRGRC
jgi:hypothetical protein